MAFGIPLSLLATMVSLVVPRVVAHYLGWSNVGGYLRKVSVRLLHPPLLGVRGRLVKHRLSLILAIVVVWRVGVSSGLAQ